MIVMSTQTTAISEGKLSWIVGLYIGPGVSAATAAAGAAAACASFSSSSTNADSFFAATKTTTHTLQTQTRQTQTYNNTTNTQRHRICQEGGVGGRGGRGAGYSFLASWGAAADFYYSIFKQQFKRRQPHTTA